MIHLVIDTNIYIRNPRRNNAAFKAVNRLIKAGALKLYIPYFVRWEFVTKQNKKITEDFSEIYKGIRGLLRKGFSGKFQSQLTKIEQQVSLIDDQLEKYPLKEFSKWAVNLGAEFVPIGHKHDRKVARDYFKGAVPFKHKKNRNDIPDAFIWQAIKDIAGKVNTLYVACDDSGLFNACQTIRNILAFRSLEEFISSDACQSILRPAFAQDNMVIFANSASAIQTALSSAVETDFFDKVIGQRVISRAIPEDNNEATIFMLADPTNIIFDFGNIEYYGAGDIVIPFKTSTEATLSYAIFKADYYMMSDKEIEKISISELNKHYYDAEEEYSLFIEGTLSIEVDESAFEGSQLEVAKIEELLDNAAFAINSIDQIDVELDDRRIDI